MKLRLEKGTVKIRLSQEEIKTLIAGNSISEFLYISEENKFEYSIHIIENHDSSSILFKSSSLSIHIPSSKAEKWMNSHQIGIKEIIVTDQAKEMILIVEEDLPPRKKKEQK